MTKIKQLIVSTAILVLLMPLFFSARAQIWQSCFGNSRPGVQNNNVENTGIDILDWNGNNKVEAIVQDGSRPMLVTVFNNMVYNNALPTSATDPDVAIFNDPNSSTLDFYINVVYYNTATSQYILDIYHLNGFAQSTPTLLASHVLVNSAFGSGPNIDVSEVGISGAITLEINGDVYASTCLLGTGSPSPICPVAKGTNPDVAVVGAGDAYLFAYKKNSTTISVTGVTNPDLLTCNGIHSTINFTGTNVDEPRIASGRSLNYTWGIVWLDHLSGDIANTVYGNVGTYLIASPMTLTPGITNINYTNSNTWVTLPTTPVDLSNATYTSEIGNPVISFNNFDEIQMGLVVYHHPKNTICGETVALGVICDGTGEPKTTNCYSTPVHQNLAVNVGGATCAPSPALNSSGGVINSEYQSAISMAGKNSLMNEFASAFFDNQSCTISGCGNEVIYKDGYNASVGFRQSKPKAESGNNLTASKLMLNISPNPFTENIKITSTNNDAICNLIITDISGRQILNANGTNEQLNAALAVCNSKLNTGIYFINIKNDSGILLNQKIVKQ